MQRPRENLRFRRTEDKILHSTRIILENNFHRNVKVAEICRKSNIEQSTFYRHYHCFEEFLAELVYNTESELKNLLYRPKFKDSHRTYSRVLFFIYKRQEAFRVILRQDMALINKILGSMKSILIKKWSRYDRGRVEYLYRLHIAEVLAVIVIWIQEENFNPNNIERHARNLNYLYNSADQRLSGVVM